MTTNNAFLASVLNQGKRALAGYAAAGLLQSQPEAGTTLGADTWQNWLSARLRELASAVAAENPQIFAGQVQWAQKLLAARGFSMEQLGASLESL